MSSPNRLRSAHHFYLKFIFDSFFSLTLYFEAPGLFACLVVNPVNAAILGNFVWNISLLKYQMFTYINCVCQASKYERKVQNSASSFLLFFASFLKLSFNV